MCGTPKINFEQFKKHICCADTQASIFRSSFLTSLHLYNFLQFYRNIVQYGYVIPMASVINNYDYVIFEISSSFARFFTDSYGFQCIAIRKIFTDTV